MARRSIELLALVGKDTSLTISTGCLPNKPVRGLRRLTLAQAATRTRIGLARSLRVQSDGPGRGVPKRALGRRLVEQAAGPGPALGQPQAEPPQPLRREGCRAVAAVVKQRKKPALGGASWKPAVSRIVNPPRRTLFGTLPATARRYGRLSPNAGCATAIATA